MKDEGKSVQKTASLHEKAVQEVARRELDPVPTPARKPLQKRSQPLERHIRVDPAVWKIAQQLLADPRKHYTRIEIINEREVIVR